MPTLPKHCDYLVIGGGSAGSIIARRLADANIGHVVLLEAGKNDEGDNKLTDLSLLDQQSEETEWGFTAFPVSGKSNEIYYYRAKMLGGCGNHNDCAFLVPPKEDFDRWSTLGASGWNGDQLKPYFDRVDNKVFVESQPPINAVSNLFLQAGEELGLWSIDFRKHIQQGGGVFPLNAKGKLRQSSSISYLHPISTLTENLNVVCNVQATKIIIEDDIAVGCETDQGNINVAKEIIVTAGAIQTPQLLMLSGIGSSKALNKIGIKLVTNLPGVGENLIDHASANIILSLKHPIPDWELTCCEVSMMLKTDDKIYAPDLLYHFILGGRDKYCGRETTFPNSVKISPNVTRPLSRGNLELQSIDISTQPKINLNYFSDETGSDMRTLIYGLRYARQIAETRTFENIVEHEQLPSPNVKTDTELRDYILDSCETVYHPCGTCKMGPAEDPTSVVTANLKVKNVASLRVCDASIFPDMVTVNINNTVMMVAEKAADLIINDASKL